MVPAKRGIYLLLDRWCDSSHVPLEALLRHGKYLPAQNRAFIFQRPGWQVNVLGILPLRQGARYCHDGHHRPVQVPDIIGDD